MSGRCLVGLGVVACAWLAASAPVGTQDLAGKAQDRARKGARAGGYTAPRTSWGEPDLQGVWSYATTTPLQRPDAMAGRDTLTDAEIEALAEAQAERQDGAPRTGDPGTYNNFWWDRGKSNGRTSLIIDPPDGKLPWKPEALAENAKRAAYRRDHPADSHLDRSPTDRCIMYHGVPPLPSGYNNTYQIFQTPGMVAILDENIHHVRLIPVDGRPHLSERVRHWNGDSRGRWDGDTLVVETRNFNDKTDLRYEGTSHTVSVERFRRSGPDLIDYTYTITDPTVFTRPFTVSLPMPRRDDKIYEYACHEGNYAMPGILAGARLAEQAPKKESR